jgi:hypothetical protein
MRRDLFSALDTGTLLGVATAAVSPCGFVIGHARITEVRSRQILPRISFARRLQEKRILTPFP